MPSLKKTLHFLSSALATSVSVGLLGFSMSTQWAVTAMDCSTDGTVYSNGTAVITVELFSGNVVRNSCPFFGGLEHFQVITSLAEGDNPATTSAVLHGLVLCLLVLCFVFSASSILISLYNSFSNPYETYMGPLGIYVCSSLSACLSVVALIIFVLNVSVTNMAEVLVENFTEGTPVDLKNKSSVMQLGYYLVIPYTVLSLLAIALIYMYDHAAYTHRREQQRPTEDAPKEIMMY